MNHEEMLGLLHDYARGRLSEEKRLTIQRALENDPSLRTELELVRAYFDELKTLPEVKAPADFLQKVRSRIERKSFFEKLRDLLFFPLYIKLPIEIAGTVAAGLLVIIILNPFSTKVNVQEKYAVTEHEAYSDETSRKALDDNEISNDKKMVTEKKLAVAEPSSKKDQPVTSDAKTGARRAIRPLASFVEPMPSSQSQGRLLGADAELAGGLTENSNAGKSGDLGRSKADGLSKAKAAPSASQSPADEAGTLKGIQRYASGYSSEADTANRVEDVSKKLELSASSPAPSTPVGVSSNERQLEPLAENKYAESQVEQLAYTWTPEAPTDFAPQSAEYESLSKMEEIDAKAAKTVRLKNKATLAAKEESLGSDQSIAINKMKSDNLEYLKTSVKHAGGSLKVINKNASQYRIKIPAKNFKLLEEELNKKGVISSTKAVDLSRYSSKDMVEIIITVRE